MPIETLQQIERAIATLSEQELQEFSDWFDRYEHPFDSRIAADFTSGKLDRAISEALAEEQRRFTECL